MRVAETATNICNIALTRIGAKEIESFENASDREAVLCRRIYHTSRRSVLASHHWNGAKRSVQLTENTSVTPVFWDYAYTLPSDFIRIISCHPSDDLNATCDFTIENANDDDADNVLMSASNQIYIQYVFDNTDLSTMSQGFRDVLAFQLARDLCLALGKSTSKFELTNREYRRALTNAKSVDGFDDYPQRLAEGSWVSSRYGLYNDKLVQTT
jgi:hypothetical protein